MTDFSLLPASGPPAQGLETADPINLPPSPARAARLSPHLPFLGQKRAVSCPRSDPVTSQPPVLAQIADSLSLLAQGKRSHASPDRLTRLTWRSDHGLGSCPLKIVKNINPKTHQSINKSQSHTRRRHYGPQNATFLLTMILRELGSEYHSHYYSICIL